MAPDTNDSDEVLGTPVNHDAWQGGLDLSTLRVADSVTDEVRTRDSLSISEGVVARRRVSTSATQLVRVNESAITATLGMDIKVIAASIAKELGARRTLESSISSEKTWDITLDPNYSTEWEVLIVDSWQAGSIALPDGTSLPFEFLSRSHLDVKPLPSD